MYDVRCELCNKLLLSVPDECEDEVIDAIHLAVNPYPNFLKKIVYPVHTNAYAFEYCEECSPLIDRIISLSNKMGKGFVIGILDESEENND